MTQPDGQLRDDDELYRRFLGGDVSAIDRLMLDYRESLICYANSFTHNIEDAEDMTMEAFAILISKKPLIGKDKFKSYIYKIVRNLCLRHIGGKSREQFVPEDELLDVLADSDSESLIERSVTEDEKTAVLRESIKELDPLTAEVIYLTYYEEMSYAQISKVLGIGVKKVDNLLVKGRKLLKEKMTKRGFDL